MLLTLFFVFTCIASLLLAKKRYYSATLIYLLESILFFSIGCGPVPGWLLNNLQKPYSLPQTPQWKERNAIILLGTGTVKIAQTNAVEPMTLAYSRLYKAFELYMDCKKVHHTCTIVATGGDPQHNGVSEASTYQDKLLRIGVNPDDIIVEPDSVNTWQNIKYTHFKLEEYKPSYITLITAGIHLERSLLYASALGIRATPIRSDYLQAIPSIFPLSYNFLLTELALHEYIGLARYHVYTLVGWNR